jgi:hypothetical protein
MLSVRRRQVHRGVLPPWEAVTDHRLRTIVARRGQTRQNRSVFTDADAHKYVSHYTSSEAFLTYILPSMSLRMSRFANVNDPRESRDWICTLAVPDELMHKDWDVFALSDRFSRFMKANAKLLCVTRDDPNLDPDRISHLYGRSYAHASLWDRYANRHSGVCLMLDTDKFATATAIAADGRGECLRMGVSYGDMPPTEKEAYLLSAADLDARGEDAVFVDHQRDHHGSLYFWKASDWASEFEYRWVLLDGSEVDVFIDIRDCLKGVVFGEAFPSGAVEMVARVIGRSDVNFAKMRYRNGHPIVLPWLPPGSEG